MIKRFSRCVDVHAYEESAAPRAVAAETETFGVIVHEDQAADGVHSRVSGV